MTALRPGLAVLLLATAGFGRAHLGPHPEAGIEFDQHPGAALPLDATFLAGSGRRETLRDAMGAGPP